MPDAARELRAIDEHPGAGRLGRHVHHDERSRAFAVTRQAVPIASRHWTRHVPIYDQGDLGSCTAQAICGAMCTGPFHHQFLSQRTMRSVYHTETVIDEFPGVWPPDDTGSSGLAACKVARNRGWIGSYRHCFSLDDVLTALQFGPVIAGVDWWSSFDRPGPAGLCAIAGSAYIRGGHEVCLVGVDVDSRTIRFANSWSAEWGASGYGKWSYATFDQLLHADGDVTVPVA